MDLRAITIRQPWAWAIAAGHKRVENRSWRPHRGVEWLAIHAGMALDAAGVAHVAQACGVAVPPAGELAHGAVVAVARIERVAPSFESAADPWVFGPLCWWLADVTPIEPVSCRGAQGLWRLKPETLAAVRERLAK